jgi:hypothetical protein
VARCSGLRRTACRWRGHRFGSVRRSVIGQLLGTIGPVGRILDGVGECFLEAGEGRVWRHGWSQRGRRRRRRPAGRRRHRDGRATECRGCGSRRERRRRRKDRRRRRRCRRARPRGGRSGQLDGARAGIGDHRPVGTTRRGRHRRRGGERGHLAGRARRRQGNDTGGERLRGRRSLGRARRELWHSCSGRAARPGEAQPRERNRALAEPDSGRRRRGRCRGLRWTQGDQRLTGAALELGASGRNAPLVDVVRRLARRTRDAHGGDRQASRLPRGVRGRRTLRA